MQGGRIGLFSSLERPTVIVRIYYLASQLIHMWTNNFFLGVPAVGLKLLEQALLLDYVRKKSLEPRNSY